MRTTRLLTTRTSLLAAAFACALALSGCAGGASADTAAPESFNAVDVTFAQMMIPHHEQAVEMSDEILAKDGVDQAVVDLATQIKAAQEPEIRQLGSWLEAWGADMGMAGMGHGTGDGTGDGTDGMMSDDDMSALADASGAEASTLFLRQMVIHHEGAIAMARTELTSGRDADAKALASAIVTGQAAEVEVMKDLLAAG